MNVMKTSSMKFDRIDKVLLFVVDRHTNKRIDSTSNEQTNDVTAI